MISENFKAKMQRLAGIPLDEVGIPRNMALSSQHSAKYRHNQNYPFHKNEAKTSTKQNQLIP